MSRESKARQCVSAVLAGIASMALFLASGMDPVNAAQVTPLLLAQASQGDLSLAEQQLQEAVAARRAKDFDRGREILAGLERRTAANDPLYWEVRDERRFHQPLAVAQQAMNEGEIGLAESKINEAARYLTTHPRHGELSRTLERYRRALWMVK